jgi:flagellar motor switch/type III secretory pathway protein FliN
MAETELAKVETKSSIAPAPEKALQVEPPPQPWMKRIEEHPSWPLLSQMTVATTAGIPIEGFKIRDLLRLEPGQIVESMWTHTEDIPLNAGRVQVAWGEFEVVDQNLMVRLTRLA